jgi:hypothetical protein
MARRVVRLRPAAAFRERFECRTDGGTEWHRHHSHDYLHGAAVGAACRQIAADWNQRGTPGAIRFSASASAPAPLAGRCLYACRPRVRVVLASWPFEAKLAANSTKRPSVQLFVDMIVAGRRRSCSSQRRMDLDRKSNCRSTPAAHMRKPRGKTR